MLINNELQHKFDSIARFPGAHNHWPHNTVLVLVTDCDFENRISGLRLHLGSTVLLFYFLIIDSYIML
jgi:hypothetical protein